MTSIPFTVDAALLRELGERLVGRPQIALAELIKNAYDADATTVEIRFGRDQIRVIDNGDGMSFADFRDRWMRVGSPHKADIDRTAGLGRPITGSKGVGRLSAQFLGDRISLRTLTEGGSKELVATVDWTKAVTAGDLQRATADYTQRRVSGPFPTEERHGTEIEITGLRQDWTVDLFQSLAQEIWNLQPPFGPTEPGGFSVGLSHDLLPEAVDAFEQQMAAVLELWDAKLVGRIGDGQKIDLVLEYRDGTRHTAHYPLAGPSLARLRFEIRVFDLRNRQPYGIRVDEARAYLNRFGGVHVYDSGFRLPYYGPDADWLRIEMDHSHRISRSRLLPDELQAPDALNFLPTNSRLFGIVNVDTGRERRVAVKSGSRDFLALQVSRDRLLDNRAYQTLRDAVRWAIDYYAVHEAEKTGRERAQVQPVAPFRQTTLDLRETLEANRPKMEPSAFVAVRTAALALERSVEKEPTRLQAQASLLGALATAGASALAYEHEIDKQLSIMESIADELQEAASQPDRETRLRKIESGIREWLERARGTRDLFAYLSREEYREETTRRLARPTIQAIARNARVLLRRVEVDTRGIDSDLLLPHGRFAEWSAIFQNALTNAAAAMRRTPDKRVVIESRQNGRQRSILVSDTGAGVKLGQSEELFEPFVRRLPTSARTRASGLAGMGLGLTIARSVAIDLQCRVRFVAPRPGFATTLEVSWTEIDD